MRQTQAYFTIMSRIVWYFQWDIFCANERIYFKYWKIIEYAVILRINNLSQSRRLLSCFNWCRCHGTGMKLPWPQPFEDGDVREFLEDFEAVAEVVGVKTDRGKLVALRSLLKGRARAVLDAAARGPVKLEWAAAKEALVAGFDGVADRQEAMRQFKELQFCRGGDPLVHAVALRKLLNRACPDLTGESERQLLVDRFLDSMPAEISGQLKLLLMVKPITIEELAESSRQILSGTVQAACVQEERNDFEQLKATINNLADQVAALRTKERKASPNDRCHKCGQRGHWRRNCPKRVFLMLQIKGF